MRRPPAPGHRLHGVRGLQFKEQIAIGLLTIAALAPVLALGANTYLLSVAATSLQLLVSLIIVGLIGASVPAAFWRAAGPPAVVFAAALVWGALGLSQEPRQDWSAGYQAAAGASFHSLTPDDTALELVKLVSLAGLVLASGLVGASGGRLRAFSVLLVLAGAAYGLFSLVLHQQNPMAVFGVSKGSHEGRFTATLLNPNAAGCLFAMLCVIACGVFIAERNRLSRLAAALRSTAWPVLAGWLIAVFFFMAACALTKSRAALAAGLIAVGLLLIIRNPPWRRSPQGRSLTRSSWILAAVLTLGVLVAGAGALYRGGDLESAARDRLQAMGHYTQFAAQAPLSGYGLGAFDAVARHGLSPEQAGHMWNFQAVHNAPLQAALEGGLPFLAFLAIALGLVLAAAARPAPSGVRSIRLGLGLSALVAALCGMVDIALQVPAIAALAFIALGACLGAGFSVRTEPSLEKARSRA